VPSLARTPARWNQIWLGGALAAVVALGGAAMRFGGLAEASVPGPAAAAVVAAPQPLPRGVAGRRLLSGVPAVAVSRRPAGTCLPRPLRAGGRYVSLPPDRFARAAMCGSYLLVQGPGGIVRAKVVGLCARCAGYMINLSRAAFAALTRAPGRGSGRGPGRRAGRATGTGGGSGRGSGRATGTGGGSGRARVTYWPEANPPLPGPISVRVGRTRGGLPTLQVRNSGNPLAGVAVGEPGIWRAFRRNIHGVWVGQDRLGTGPFAVRITDDLGHQAVLPRVMLIAGRTVRTRQWMYRTGSGEPARARVALAPVHHDVGTGNP
jgi:expansin (peptidoglycan-binding protein)